MGLSDTVHHLSWFVTAFLNFFWISLSSTYVAHISFLPASNPVLLFLYFFFFNLSEVTLAFLIRLIHSSQPTPLVPTHHNDTMISTPTNYPVHTYPAL